MLEESPYNNLAEEESQEHRGLSQEERGAFYKERMNLLWKLREDHEGIDPETFLASIDEFITEWPLDVHFKGNYQGEVWHWLAGKKPEDVSDLELVDRMIDCLAELCANRMTDMAYNQIAFTSSFVPREMIEKLEIFEAETVCIKSTCPEPYICTDDKYRRNIMWDFVKRIYDTYEESRRLQEDDSKNVPILICGVEKRGDEEEKGPNDEKYFFYKQDGKKNTTLKNLTIVKLPEMEKIDKDVDGNPLSGTLGIDNRTLLSLLLVARKTLTGVEKFVKADSVRYEMEQKEKAKTERKKRVKEINKINLEEAPPKIEYKVITERDVNIFMDDVVSQVKHWHNFKPDYVFLTETSAVSAGYMFREAWRVAYPDEEPPKFYRVDPVAMGINSNTRNISGYEEKLEDFLKKRIKKSNARIAIFDEQPVSGKSQLRVGSEISKKLNIPWENIDINRLGDTRLYNSQFFISGRDGTKLTTKSGHSEPARPVEFKSIEDVKFVGDVAPVHGGQKANYNYWGEHQGTYDTFNRLDLIADLKMVGRLAGKKIYQR